MLDERGIPYRYREYTKEPLSRAEIEGVLLRLGLPAREILRGRDAKAAGLGGDEPEADLVAAMAANPSLIQRPIGVAGDRAVVGRPVERLLELVGG